jgi:hypothetical protein
MSAEPCRETSYVKAGNRLPDIEQNGMGKGNMGKGHMVIQGQEVGT